MELVDLDLSQLPKAKGMSKPGVTLFQGCWVRSNLLPNVIAFQQKLQAHDDHDTVLLASYPKSGTTWLKALLFSIVNRARYAPSETPLHTSSPHKLVPPLEYYAQVAHSLRLLATHVPYALLPERVVGKCRIVYICRNPLDTIVSFWNYMTRGHPECYGPEWTMDECVETFRRGESHFGPFWDHMLGFWKASLEALEKVLFVKYEDMLEDTASQVKRIAEFLGLPFSEEEETSGTVKQIVELCSLRSLKELDVNKHGKSIAIPHLENKNFFRKGQVGDWVNHLTPSMAESVKRVMEEQLHGFGLTFKYSV